MRMAVVLVHGTTVSLVGTQDLVDIQEDLWVVVMVATVVHITQEDIVEDTAEVAMGLQWWFWWTRGWLRRSRWGSSTVRSPTFSLGCTPQ